MTSPGVIDTHHHLWELAVTPQPWITGSAVGPLLRDFTLADYAEASAAAGVDRSVVVQSVNDIKETRRLLALAASSDLIVGVVGWVDLTSVDVAEQIADLRSGTGGQLLAGIRHVVQDEPDPRWLLRPDVQRGLAEVGAAGLVYDLLVLPHQLPAAIEAVDALPGQSFVLDHLAKPDISGGEHANWENLILSLAARPHVSAKVSGLLTQADWASWQAADLAPYVDLAVHAFGAERLMWGSDWPVSTAAASYAETLDVISELVNGLPVTQRKRIFSDTAQEIYALRR